MAATYGVFFNEEEFISKVAELTHPFDMPMYLDESNLEAMTFIMSHSPSEVAVYRSECIRYYIHRAKFLSQEEKSVARVDACRFEASDEKQEAVAFQGDAQRCGCF